MPSRTLQLALLVPLLISTLACSMTATMIPVQGPLSQQQPTPVIAVKVKGIMGNSGDFLFALPPGAQCKGRWASAAGSGAAFGSATLLNQYGTTYISGFSVSAGHGQNPGQALATCSDGNVLQLEFVTGAGTAHGYGIGKDNQSNIYKFVF